MRIDKMKRIKKMEQVRSMKIKWVEEKHNHFCYHFFLIERIYLIREREINLFLETSCSFFMILSYASLTFSLPTSNSHPQHAPLPRATVCPAWPPRALWNTSARLEKDLHLAQSSPQVTTLSVLQFSIYFKHAGFY